MPKEQMNRMMGKAHAIIVRLDDSGKVLETLQDTTGKFSSFSEVMEQDGHLLIGSPFNNYIAKVKLEQ